MEALLCLTHVVHFRLIVVVNGAVSIISAADLLVHQLGLDGGQRELSVLLWRRIGSLYELVEIMVVVFGVSILNSVEIGLLVVMRLDW